LSLSSGLDSRALLGFLPDDTLPIPTFTYGTTDCYDVIFAGRLAELRRCPNCRVAIPPDRLVGAIPQAVLATSGLLHGSMFYHWPLVREMALSLDAELCGAGGDVYTGAYLSRAAFRCRTDEDVMDALMARRRLVNLGKDNGKSLVCSRMADEAEDILRASFRRCLAKCTAQHPVNRMDFFHIHEIDRKCVRSGDMVRRLALDVRTPFYDRDVVDVLLTMKPEWRKGQSAYIAILREELPALAGVGRDLTGVSLKSSPAVASVSQKVHSAAEAICRYTGMDSARIVQRRRPFDWARNLRNGMAEFVRSACLHPRLLDNPLMNADGIRHAVETHLSACGDRSIELGGLLAISFVLAGGNSRDWPELDVPRRETSSASVPAHRGRARLLEGGNA
jgi:hypothetical protein